MTDGKGVEPLTLFEPVDHDQAHADLARTLDQHRPVLDRLDAAHALQLTLWELFPQLTLEARQGGATWQTIAAVLNLTTDEVQAVYAQAVVTEAKLRPGFDAASAYSILPDQVGE